VTVSERLVKRATAVTKSDNPLDRGLMELWVVSLVMAFSKECYVEGEWKGQTWLLTMMLMMRMNRDLAARTLIAWPLAGVSQGQENAAMALKIPRTK
jgi:hypothetical protein